MAATNGGDGGEESRAGMRAPDAEEPSPYSQTSTAILQAMTDAQVQQMVEHSLARLGPLATNLTVIFSHPEHMPPGAPKAGFANVMHGKDVAAGAAVDLNVDAYLVVRVGGGLDSTIDVVRSLNQSAESPPIIVLMLMPSLDNDGLKPRARSMSPEAVDYEVEVARSLTDTRTSLYEAGADETLCLFSGEQLTASRMLEILQKCDLLARRMTDIILAETNSAQKKAVQKVKMAYQKFLYMLPGHVLDCIPLEDTSMEEEKDGNSMIGIGNYKFVNKLGQGSFSLVFKASHPEHGTCVVKVLPKAHTGKNMASLFSLDREICLTRYLQPHPNVLSAFAALNTSTNFGLVMEYGGPWVLHRFVREYLRRSGQSALPKAVIKSFGTQQAAAVEHLHSANVCHRDLKPDNWVVCEAGDTLRLSDLGLAMQVIGPGQLLTHSCGSLPFCAPEVFSCGQPGHGGYDGFAADIWSLSVNWIELILGPYSIERLIGWLPNHPSDAELVLAGLKTLATRWKPRPQEEDIILVKLIRRMLIVEPKRRWGIGDICGSRGLNLSTMAHPARSRSARPHILRLSDCYRAGNTEGSAQARSTSSTEGFNVGPCQSVRLGGFSVLSAAFKQALDGLLATSGYNQAYMSRPAGLSDLQKLFQQEVPNIFDTEPGSKEELSVQERVKELHLGVPICNCHIKVMTEHLLVAFSDFSISDEEAVKAVDRFNRLVPQFTDDSNRRVARARAQNSKEWRLRMVGQLREQIVASFGEGLVANISSDPVLRRTRLVNLQPSEVQFHLLQYLSCNPEQTDEAPVPWDLLKGERFPPRLIYVEAARVALETSGVDPEVVETLYYTLLGLATDVADMVA